MSEFNDIKKLWKSADSQIMANESLDLETVKQAITKLSIGITFKLLLSIRAGIVALALSGLLFGYNIYSYSGNNLITILSISGLITSSLLFLYLISKHNSFNKLDQLGLSLQDLIVAKIHIFNKSLSLVHQAISIGLVLLVFSLISDPKNSSLASLPCKGAMF